MFDQITRFLKIKIYDHFYPTDNMSNNLLGILSVLIMRARCIYL